MPTGKSAVTTNVEQSNVSLRFLSAAFTLRRLLAVYTVIVGIYVYLPILTLIGFSFNAGGLNFPFTSFTTEWYGALLQNESMLSAIKQSLQLALVVMIITTVLATLALLAYRREFRGKKVFLYLVVLGIITPGITYGIGANILINNLLGISGNLWAAVPVHVVWTFPFSFIILLAGTPAEIGKHEQAARVMGASTSEIFRRILLPQIGPAVLGAAIFSLTLSYNEGTRSILLLGTDNTMPIYIFSAVASTAPSPELYALGSVTTGLSMLLLSVSFGVILYRNVNP